MLRQTTFAENQDSDQSISEEEDFALDWPENCIPLGETAERKGGVQIQSQLEVLRDTYEIDHGSEPANSVNKGQAGVCSEDEVEVPFFHDEGDFISSPGMASISNLNEDLISDDEKIALQNSGSQRSDEACTWSAVNKEAEALVHLIENARSSSLHSGNLFMKKPYKGGRSQAKPKLSFRFQSHREDTPLFGSKIEVGASSGVSPLLEELEGGDKSIKENAMAEPLVQGGMLERSDICSLPAEVRFERGYGERSMVDLLDNYQEKNGVPIDNSRMIVEERSISPFGQRKLDCEDLPEGLDSGSSTDDEASLPTTVQNLGLIIPSSEQKTMTDKFQEAFGTATVNQEAALHGIGVFGKLQQVMQSEKKRDMEFMKRLQTGGSLTDETICIDVDILSRCLDAKLIVCCCSPSRGEEQSNRADSSEMIKENQRILTIIFSPRVCDDVELEVGSKIRIYSPWKEVNVGGKDVILSAYFSQILS